MIRSDLYNERCSGWMYVMSAGKVISESFAGVDINDYFRRSVEGDL